MLTPVSFPTAARAIGAAVGMRDDAGTTIIMTTTTITLLRGASG